MGRRNLERLREWIAVCRLPHPSFWYGAFGLMWLCVGHSPRLLSFICLPRFSPCLTLLPLAVSPVSLIWFGFLMWSRVGRFSRMVSITIKRFTPQLGWKRKKKKVVQWVLFFWWGGGRHISASTRPPKKKKILKKKKKISRSWDVSDLLRLFFFDEVCGRGLSQILVFKEVCKLNQSYFAHILYIIVR